MKNIVLVSASPKINEDSASEFLIKMAENHINTDNIHKTFINARESITKHKTNADFEILSQADAVIIAFPLYVFCLPGILTRYLENYYSFYLENKGTKKNTKLYAIINCGFPEPEINLEASRIIQSFCRHINADFRFGVLIGGGGMVLHALEASFMKKTVNALNDAFLTIAKDIENNDFKNTDNIYIKMNFPRFLYFFMGHRNWISSAQKNGLKKKELYRKPYWSNK